MNTAQTLSNVTLNLANVHCPDCARDLVDMILEIKGVSKCDFDKEKLALTVGYAVPATEAAIKRAIENAGYGFNEEKEIPEQGGRLQNKLIMAAIIILILIFTVWSRGF